MNNQSVCLEMWSLVDEQKATKKEVVVISPCDGCKNEQRCSDEKLSCSSFNRWLDGSTKTTVFSIHDRLPTAGHYRKIFG
jgi:hypothetical protein